MVVKLFLYVQDCGQMLNQSLYIAVGLLWQANCTRYKQGNNGERYKQRHSERR